MSDSYYSKPQREEYFVDSGYYKYHEAYHLLKFANEKQILEKAYNDLKELGDKLTDAQKEEMAKLEKAIEDAKAKAAEVAENAEAKVEEVKFEKLEEVKVEAKKPAAKKKAAAQAGFNESAWEAEWIANNPDWDKVLLIPVVMVYEQTGGYSTTLTSIQNDLKPAYAKLRGGAKGDALQIEVTYTSFD